MDSSVLDRFLINVDRLVAEILEEVVDGVGCRRDEIDGVGFREAFALHFEALDVVEVGFVDVEELATGGEDTEGCLV